MTALLILITFFAGGALGFLAYALCATGARADAEIKRMMEEREAQIK